MATKEANAMEMKVRYDDELSLKLISNKLSSLIPIDQEIVCLCIGTDRATGDSMAPFVGMMLKQHGVKNVFGTIDFPVHAVNLQSTIYNIKQSYNNPFVIAVDACLGRRADIGKVIMSKSPLYPGAGVNKRLPAVGDISITGVVNVSDYMEYETLQWTRLSMVMHLASSIAKVILDGLFQNIKLSNQEHVIKNLSGVY